MNAQMCEWGGGGAMNAQILFGDSEDYNTDVSHRSVPRRKCTKLHIAPE